MASNKANIRPYSSSHHVATSSIHNSDNQATLHQSAHNCNANSSTTHESTPASQTARIISSQPLLSSPTPDSSSKRRKLDPSPSPHSVVMASAALTRLSLDSHERYSAPRDPGSYSYAPNFVNFPSSTTSQSQIPFNSTSSSSRSSSPLSSSSGSNDEMPSSRSSSPSTTPPSSPDMRREIRHRGKQLKSRCTCCHVCRTSLKNYPRLHLECSECNAVVCQPCLENRLEGTSWEEARRQSRWLCPSCLGTCVCQRCNTRPPEYIPKPASSSKRKTLDEDDMANIPPPTGETKKKLDELTRTLQQQEQFISEIQSLLYTMRKEKKGVKGQIKSLLTGK